MSGLLSEINPLSLLSIISISFIIGSISSLHCVGMCGPIMMINSKTLKEKMLYQVGRLIAYFCLLLLVFSFKREVVYFVSQTLFFKIVFYLIGGAFILYGISMFTPINLRIKRLELVYNKLFKKILALHEYRSLLLGLISILLPCSTLYLFLIGVLSLLKIEFALFALITFWLPTSMALVFGSEILSFFKFKKAPHFYGAFFVFIGFFTIALRLYNWQGLETFCY